MEGWIQIHLMLLLIACIRTLKHITQAIQIHLMLLLIENETKLIHQAEDIH